MSWVDLSIVFILACFTIYGLLEGLICQLAGLAGLLAGLALAALGYRLVAALLMPWLGSGVAVEGIAFVGIFFGVWVMAHLWGLKSRAKVRSRGSWGEDLGGALFGLISGAFIAILSIALLLFLDAPFIPDIAASRLGGYFLAVAQNVVARFAQ